jgi:hypothetical protein
MTEYTDYTEEDWDGLNELYAQAEARPYIDIREPVPEADYIARIERAEMGVNDWKQCKQLKLTLVITSGLQEGRKLWVSLDFEMDTLENRKASVQRYLTTISRLGLDIKPGEIEGREHQFLDIVCECSVKHNTSKKGKTYANTYINRLIEDAPAAGDGDDFPGF